MAFVKRVYTWVFIAILLAVVGTWGSITSGLTVKVLTAGRFSWLMVVGGWMGIGWLANKVRHTPTLNIIAFVGYALYTGLVVSAIVMVALFLGAQNTGNPGTYIYQALGITVVAFGGITAYAWTSKRDFSWMRGILWMASLGLIACMLINMFIVESTFFSLGISFAVVLLMGGYILFDTQKIVREYPVDEHLAGAIALFTNFVVLFMHILRIILLLASDR